MRKQQALQLSLLGLLTAAGATVAAARRRKAKQALSAKVMLLGVAHFDSKNDVHNSVFEDSPLSPKRQGQVADIIRRLSRFRPTKVLIEAPMDDPKFAEQYRQFLTGQFTLPASERYQFGFKLAARAKNGTIYPIDTFGPTPADGDSAVEKRQIEWLQAHFEDVSTPAFTAYLSRLNTLERGGTYLDVLRHLNTDAAIRANASVYSVLVGMGREADSAGSAYVAQWYTRNCCIFSNILSVVQPGNRVVVIMGQGHEYLLREFVQLHPNLVLVDSLNYLK